MDLEGAVEVGLDFGVIADAFSHLAEELGDVVARAVGDFGGNSDEPVGDGEFLEGAFAFSGAKEAGFEDLGIAI